MTTRDSRVDDYIAKLSPPLREVCTRFRDIVHEAAPEIGEDIKWGHPSFVHKGIVCGMASFKAHVHIHFWKESLLRGSHARRATDDKTLDALGRVTSASEMPAKSAIAAYVKAAVKLNDGAVKAPKPIKAAKKTRAPLRTPPILAKALARNAKAKKTYEGFSASHKREYVEWISEAKTEATRDRRIEQALGWLAEGKPRNWKYMK